MDREYLIMALNIAIAMVTILLGILPSSVLLFFGLFLLLAGIDGLLSGQYFSGVFLILHWIGGCLGIVGLSFASCGVKTTATAVMLLIGLVALLVGWFYIGRPPDNVLPSSRTIVLFWFPAAISVAHLVLIGRKKMLGNL